MVDLQQLPVWRVLERALAENRLPHALLMAGERLADLEHVAGELASRLLNTTQPRSHPDYYELRPQKKARMINVGSEAERSRGQWPPNSMRRLIADLALSAQAGDRKVAVVFEADRMNAQTANAFLKTLEEPPRGTVLLLLSERPYALLATIRSRCMNLRLPESGSAEADPRWEAWLDDYRGWLERLTSGKLDRAGAAGLVTEVYGLVSRFETISASLADAAWEAVKDQQPEHLTDDAREANEVGFRKSLRTRLFGDIEAATLGLARAADDKAGATTRAPRAIETLEQAFILTDRLNYQQPAALEWFFLQSLQIWTR